MSIDTEFGVSRDIRNNPVLREVDSRHRGELRRYMLLVALGVVLLLFSAWQRGAVREHATRIEALKQSQKREETLNRELRLNVETFSAPQFIAQKALALGLRAPSLSETLVIERVPAPAPATGVVARAR